MALLYGGPKVAFRMRYFARSDRSWREMSPRPLHRTCLNSVLAQIRFDRIFDLKDKKPTIGLTINWFAPIKAMQFVNCEVQNILKPILRTHSNLFANNWFLLERSPVLLSSWLVCHNFRSPPWHAFLSLSHWKSHYEIQLNSKSNTYFDIISINRIYFSLCLS